MHSRMSRLRRSLSRSSLFGLTRAQSTRTTDIDDNDIQSPQQSPNNIHSLLVDKFSTPSAFAQLRQIVQTNNDSLREIIAIFNERAALDFAYSKTMHKLSSRLHKISQNANGVIDEGWMCVAEQFESQANIHDNLGSAISDDIVQPLRAIFNSQHQAIRSSEVLVNRELKKLSEIRQESLRIKRHLYSSSRDLEKIEQMIDSVRTNSVKLSIKKRKLLEEVTKQENDYLNAVIENEKQRRSTNTVLRRNVQRLEMIEKQRLAHSQTALGRFQRKIQQLGTNLNMMYERYMNSLNNAVNSDPILQIANLKPTANPHHTIYLCDFYAENFGELVNAERRRWALERASMLLDEQRQQLDERVAQQSDNTNAFTFNEFIEYMSFKVDESLNCLRGIQTDDWNRLSNYKQKNKDKMGLPQTVLIIPLDETTKALPKPNRSSLPTTSSTDDYEYEQIYVNSSDNATSSNRSRDMMTSSENNTSNAEHEIRNDDKTKQICRVLYDFNANADDEITIKAGDCVIIEGRINDDWLYGYTISDKSKTGRFPTTYVTQ